MSKYKVERVGFEDAAFREMSAEVRQTGPDSKQLIGQNYEFGGGRQMDWLKKTCSYFLVPWLK